MAFPLVDSLISELMEIKNKMESLENENKKLLLKIESMEKENKTLTEERTLLMEKNLKEINY